MPTNWEDVPFPKRQKKVKGQKKSSGRGSGTQVGMAWLLLAAPISVMLGCALFIAHGYHII